MKKRTLENQIISASASFSVLLVTGPRQVGKTTLLQQCAEEGRGYVTLDDLNQRALAKSDPALFLQANPPPVTIDEVQYAPELFSAIKIVVDRERKLGAFWLTGSQKFSLMRGISETLAGRIAIIEMQGLSQAEIEERLATLPPFIPTHRWIQQAREEMHPIKPLPAIYQQIWKGSYPQPVTDDKINTELYFSSYVQTYIQRDVRDLLKVSDPIAFSRFLRSTAARTGELLNYSSIARDAGVDHKTVKSWLSVLESSGLIYLLQPLHSNLTRKLVHTPKIYFLDTGLCSYLTRWSSAQSLEAGAMSGAILETWFVSEILKGYWHNLRTPYLYYYRDTNQKEIDLVIEDGNTLYPVEFKKSALPTKDAIKNFNVLSRLKREVGEGAVLSLCDRDFPITDTVTAIPAHYL